MEKRNIKYYLLLVVVSIIMLMPFSVHGETANNEDFNFFCIYISGNGWFGTEKDNLCRESSITIASGGEKALSVKAGTEHWYNFFTIENPLDTLNYECKTDDSSIAKVESIDGLNVKIKGISAGQTNLTCEAYNSKSELKSHVVKIIIADTDFSKISFYKTSNAITPIEKIYLNVDETVEFFIKGTGGTVSTTKLNNLKCEIPNGGIQNFAKDPILNKENNNSMELTGKIAGSVDITCTATNDSGEEISNSITININSQQFNGIANCVKDCGDKKCLISSSDDNSVKSTEEDCDNPEIPCLKINYDGVVFYKKGNYYDLKKGDYISNSVDFDGMDKLTYTCAESDFGYATDVGIIDSLDGTGNDFDTIVSTCTSLLGDPGTDTQPAYWIQLILNIMKYIGVVLLIVLTTLDFIKAIVSQDNDALKKASTTSIKRIIIVIILFFLPYLLKLLLILTGVYEEGYCLYI